MRTATSSNDGRSGQALETPALCLHHPYDPEKHVWVVDDNMQVIYRFTNDGKQLVQTSHTEVEGGWTHFTGRRSSIGCPNGTFSSPTATPATRVAKSIRNGKFIKDWGSRAILRMRRVRVI